MKRFASWMMTAMLFGMVALGSIARAEDEPGFEPLFDGKSLKNWDGNPEFWSVVDGAIVGQTTAEKPTKGNTFLIYRGGDVADFELRLEFQINGGNSGIQYRSEEAGKWVIKGYQADFDAAGGWTGTLYEEKGRGVLAKRGAKVEVTAEGKKNALGTTAEEKAIVESIKKDDWNSYTIIAKGNHLQQIVNGNVTVDLVDHEESKRKMSGLLALQLHAGPPMTVKFRNIRIKKLSQEEAPKNDCADEAAEKATAKKKVVFVAGKPSHGYGAHEHNAGCLLLAKELQAAMPEIECVVHQNGWPSDTSIFDGASTIVMYCDGGGGHMVNPHLEFVDTLAKKGVGIVCVHYGVEVPKGASGQKFLEWIGGYFETDWSVNPHWTAKYEKFPDHPISRGVKPFEINDEWYYHMRFREEMKGVTPILSALPPKETLSRGDGPHSGNPAVRQAVAKGEVQHMAWAAEREDGGRGFGFTGGHDHWNWGDPNFRKVMLNAIVWTAKAEVPTNGVESPKVTLPDLEVNQDYKKPDNFDENNIKNRVPALKDASSGKSMKTSPVSTKAAVVKPLYRSALITTQTPGHSVDIEVDISKSKQLYLVATDGGDGFGCDWVAWAQPRLVGPSGEKKLTDVQWKSAQSGFGKVHVNKNCEGTDAIQIGDDKVDYGIGAHAPSVIVFDLPEGYEKFKVRAAIDRGGSGQGCGSSVEFVIYDKNPGTLTSNAATVAANRDPADATSTLDVAEGLEANLFTSEPEISNITSIDIDHLGRIWACEVKNYRRHNGSRPEGDRILVLEDTDGDGKADKSTVFYQGRDIDSAHGICVLGNRVIVSAGDKVQVFYDDNGDLKADDKRDLLFTGIEGTQHDHGIHAFVFGPDGKLYFNFGNSGRRLKDKDGKVVVDMAGNEVHDHRKPYQEGMVFRCNLDGSQLETLGWNFRNNWEVCVDSLGTMWQSDNDDDGNKGVRINYVMDFGNYGYRDEITGAGWQSPRENIETEIPLRHWHLNDPGVVPNLIQTGAGSPTGICVYEGTLLPKIFHNQVIHCDAGPNICRAYITTKDGAGYKAEMLNIAFGARDNWFRPADVCVATDGSLFIGDWYDPGVGGHNQQDVDRGRIFRVAPPGSKYAPPKYDFSSITGCIEALKSPNGSARYMAWTALAAKGNQALPALNEVIASTDNDRLKARAIWLSGKIEGNGEAAVKTALNDKSADIQVVGIRLARQLKMDVSTLAPLVKSPAPEVRREVAISLRHSQSSEAPAMWAELASQYTPGDRWYLEALGISADKNWDTYLAAYLKQVGDKWNSEAGRDIIWRSRAKETPALLAKILKDESTKEADLAKMMRAFDFLSGPEKDAALKSILE